MGSGYLDRICSASIVEHQEGELGSGRIISCRHWCGWFTINRCRRRIGTSRISIPFAGWIGISVLGTIVTQCILKWVASISTHATITTTSREEAGLGLIVATLKAAQIVIEVADLGITGSGLGLGLSTIFGGRIVGACFCRILPGCIRLIERPLSVR